MKTLGMLIVVLFLAGMAMGVERPPAMGPNDVPFVYDPNLCLSPVMDWVINEPNISGIYSVGSHNKWGVKTELTVYTAGETVLVQPLGKYKDPNEGWNHYWSCMFTFADEGVHYL